MGAQDGWKLNWKFSSVMELFGNQEVTGFGILSIPNFAARVPA
jgi:hypothetical protein